MGDEIVARARAAFTRVLAASIAAALAYGLARLMLGQPKPIFAAISAIICLAPGIPSHFRQSVNILMGVGLGIIIGDLVFALPLNIIEVQMALAVGAAMMLGAASAAQPVVPIQAGASALLVIVMGPQYAGMARFLDVIIGVAIGLAFAIIFFRARLKF